MYQQLAWRRLDVEGHAVAGLDRHREGEHGVWVEADELVVERRRVRAVRLNIDLDPAWRTTFAFIHVLGGAPYRSMTIERGEADAWIVNGRRRRALDGCLDIDVAATPLTNTMAIRRLALKRGQEGVIRVAWVDVPSLRTVPAEQAYRRVGPADGGLELYEYRSPPDAAPYRLTVDDDGLVVDYEDFAQRVMSRLTPVVD